jgi:DNA helicase-2/ATP-dependent DNA helicase PcrA
MDNQFSEKKIYILPSKRKQEFLKRIEKDLNEEQKKVVLEADGPSLVIAGPGSGKTRTVIYRLGYLIALGYSPNNIMLLTFTNHAAKNMINRATALIGEKAEDIWGGTFHHVGNRILRIFGKEISLKGDYNILDREDSADLIDECLEEMGEEELGKNLVLEIFSYKVNTGKNWDEVLKIKAPHIIEKVDLIERVFKRYEERKRELNLVDYDDLLMFWYKLLMDKDKVKKILNDKFIWLLVDEYQDTNWLQGEIVRLMREENKNVLVVGDDAQCIYSFRGATIDNILNFPNIFLGTKIFYLEYNYRSTPEIIALANEIIKRNVNQYPKTIKPVLKSGSKPKLVWVRDEEEEAQFVAEVIKNMHQEGIKYKNIGVLFRSNYHSMSLQMELTTQGIPYEVRGGLRFFEQAHIKDMLSILKILYNPQDELSAQRFFKLFPGIGRAYSKKLASILRETRDFERIFQISVSGRTLEGIRRIKDLWDKIKNIPLDRFSDILLIFYNEEYKNYLETKYPDFKDREKDVIQLINFSQKYKSLGDFLSELTLYTYAGEKLMEEEEEEKDYVVLSTIHQAKGLEWDVVFILRLVQGEFPSYKSMDNLEEERRLFYVAVTRAKRELFVITHMMRRFKDMNIFSKPSIFIEELPKEELFEEWIVKKE